MVWGFGRVGRSLFADSSRYQAIYETVVAWLDGHGVSVAGLWAQHFNVDWMLRSAQQITGRVNTTLSFWLITLLYVIMGLIEVDDLHRQGAGLPGAGGRARGCSRPARTPPTNSAGIWKCGR